MSTVHPAMPKMAVRDGYDDEDLTDIDDEVFIRDGKNGSLKIDDDSGVKRPLMAPRRKCKKSCSFNRHKFPYRALWLPLCYGLTALTVIIILIILCIFTANIFPMPLTVLRNWLSHELKEPPNDTSIVPCTSLATKLLWSRTVPKLILTSHLTSTDANRDGVEDIVFGFNAGVDTVDTLEHTCTWEFEGQGPCMGGVLVLNGHNGDTLWTHWTAQTIQSVDCSLDLTNDEIKDCVVSNEVGILHAISGADGTSIWELPVEHSTPSDELRISGLYDAKFVADIDGDGIGDVIASHAVQSFSTILQTFSIRSSEILMISGASGKIIHKTTLPETEQVIVRYLQTLIHPDGENIFVLTTYGQKQTSNLYVVPQVNLMYGDLKLRKLQHSIGKGPIVPPILVDITSDEVEDIIAAMFNSSIVAYDGLTFEPLWNYTVPDSEVISIPVPGYYNDDDIPDFLVKHQIGSGFPTYYYTIATVIDGKTGKPLLEKPMEDSLSREMSGLSITVDDFGNDWFLHWSADCRNFEGTKEKYQFLQGEKLEFQVEADLCKLRFNSTLVSNLFALSQHVGPPGVSLYSSDDWRAVEFNNSGDPNTNSLGAPFVSARSPKTQKTQAQENSFKSEGEDVPEVPVSPDRYNSEAGYDKYAEYKGQKRLSLSDMEGRRYPDTGDTFNPEYAWKRGENEKWPREKIDAEKEYEIAYDNENNVGPVDDRNVDYPRVDEIREQRSDTEDRANMLNRDSDSMTSSTNSPNSVNRVPFNTNNSIRRKRESNFTLERKVISLQEFLAEWTNMYNISSSSAEPDYNSTFGFDTLRDNNITSNSDELDSIIKSAEKYVHIYPRRIEDTNDENIEKIFKRESLKNQKKRFNPGRRLKNERHKRQAENQSGKKSTDEGVQRQPHTGILLPTITESNKGSGRTSVDLVFATSWSLRPDISAILLPEDLECVHRKKALSPRKFQYRDSGEIEKECLAERGVDYKLYQESMERENRKAFVGQMTVYRMNLECVCPEDMLPNQNCKNISPHQSWPQYLGAHGGGHFRPLRKPKARTV